MFVFIITLFIFGCMNMKTHKSNNSKEYYFSKAVDKRYKTGIENFVYLIKKHKIQIDCDEIKEKERKQVFDDRFIELARLTYQTNDERFFLKYKINEYFNSDIVEEKNIS